MEKVGGVSGILRPSEFNVPRSDHDGLPSQFKGNHDIDQIQHHGNKEKNKQVNAEGINPSSKGIVRMAKRNARERNRVRQVNQGFLTLRHHLPEPFRVSRMSKVDTLRSALGYIISLEKVLDEGTSAANENSTDRFGSDDSSSFVQGLSESKENQG